jgi:hypothetical protein
MCKWKKLISGYWKIKIKSRTNQHWYKPLLIAKSCRYMRPISYRIGYQDEIKILTQLRMKSKYELSWGSSQLSNNGHRVDIALVGAGSLWHSDPTLKNRFSHGWGSSLL